MRRGKEGEEVVRRKMRERVVLEKDGRDKERQKGKRWEKMRESGYNR